MIADCRLQIEVYAFLTGGIELLNLKSKIAGTPLLALRLNFLVK